MPNPYSVVITTAGSIDEANALARGLVEERLVACAQLLPMTSVYRWDGKVQNDSEVLLLLKAPTKAYAAIEAYLLEHHSYDTPEIIQVPVTTGSTGYLSWISSCVRTEAN